MPLEAPVMKTFNDGESIPARRESHLFRAYLRDKIIQNLDRAIKAIRRGRAGLVLALDGQRRHAVDLVVLDHLLVAILLRLRRERVVGGQEFLRIDALRRKEFGLIVRRQQIVVILMDFVEDHRRQLLLEAERIECMKQFRMRNEIIAESSAGSRTI